MITRDGEKVSIWQQFADPYTPKQKQHDRKVEIIIAGGGITGITNGLLLQKAGFRCTVLEASSLCFGTTSGTTAHLNTLLDTPYTQITKNFNSEASELIAKATATAIDLIRGNIDMYKIDCGFSLTDAYLFAQDDGQTKELEDIQQATVEAGIEVHEVSSIPINSSFTKAIAVPGQGKFIPVKYVYALASAFEEAGGTIREQCRVIGVRENEEIEVETSTGKIYCSKLIFATHIPPGINLLHLRCAPYRSYAIAFTLADANYFEGLCYDMYDPYHYYRSQEIDGKKLIIAGGYDHKTGHQENTSRSFDDLIAHCKSLFAVEKIEAQWSSQYFEPADGLPYIGVLPGSKGNVYVATGFGGNGMVYSQVAAVLLRDILMGRENSLEDLLKPSRIKPIAGFQNFVEHNVDVVKEFAGKLFTPTLDDLADLSPGEGRVVEYEGKKVALHKDESGQLHAVHSACTHMKCDVKWNNAEGSWDCPCHGARYDKEGEVLTGPATMPLESIRVKE